MGNSKKPQYRFALKAEIIRTGHRSLKEFAQAMGGDLPRLSRIVSGFEIPGPTWHRRIAQALKITQKQLTSLL